MPPEITPPELTDAEREQLKSNLGEVCERIAVAATRSGRDASSVKLVAVTKYVDVRFTRALVELGCSSLGESRPQSLWQKAAELSDLSIDWHMIGNLQRNKLERTLPHLAVLHSGDSLRLLEAVDATCIATSKKLVTLIEVNVSGDAAKHGFKPDEVETSFEDFAKFKGVELCGLMTMGGRDADADETRQQFAALRELRDRLVQSSPDSLQWNELSMGMSGDYEIAIEEGATMVRVGSALFEGINTDG